MLARPGAAGDDELERFAGELEPLGSREDRIDGPHGIIGTAQQQVAARKLGAELDVLARLREVAVLGPRGLQDVGGVGNSAVGRDRQRVADDRVHHL